MHNSHTRRNLLLGTGLGCLFGSLVFAAAPGDSFDLGHWKITLPTDADGDGKADEVDVPEIQGYTHPDFFYLDEAGNMVFTTPNKATTTPNSPNARSELRQMIRGTATRIGGKDPGNNFALQAHERASEFGAIGGRLSARLRVDHVPLNAGKPANPSAYAVVVGQIHAGKDPDLLDRGDGFGWGNEPVKIFFKKWPGHATGSVFWTYERNLPRDDPDRVDIAYPVWGRLWDDAADPGCKGVALGEPFSYSINVFGNTAYLAFESAAHETVRYRIDLSNDLDAHGQRDRLDHPRGYAGEWFYFKAGAYNQCTAAAGEESPECGGTGIWAVDRANGDYASVAFSSLVLGQAKDPAE